MTAPPQANGNGAEQPMLPTDPNDMLESLMNALTRAAADSAATDNSAEVRNFAQACLFYAQSIVVLDPTRSGPDGTPLAHAVQMAQVQTAGQLAVEQTRQDGQAQLAQARQASAAPHPAQAARRRATGQ